MATRTRAATTRMQAATCTQTATRVSARIQQRRTQGINVNPGRGLGTWTRARKRKYWSGTRMRTWESWACHHCPTNSEFSIQCRNPPIVNAGGGGGGNDPPNDDDGGVDDDDNEGLPPPPYGMPPPPPIVVPPAAQPPFSEIGEMLTVCGATPVEVYALETTERLNTFRAYRGLDSRTISALASRLEKRPPHERVQLPTLVIQNLISMCYWIKRKYKLRQNIYGEDFTVSQIDKTADLMEHENDDDDAPSVKCDTLKPVEWDSWESKFTVYLSDYRGRFNDGLDYVIRAEPPTRLDLTDEYSERRWTGFR